MDITPVTQFIGHIFTTRGLERIASVVGILVGGYILVRFSLAVIRRLAAKHGLKQHSADIVEKIVKYGGTLLILINASEASGFDLTAALGAAGIAGIAIGFAAQTSVSNIISGLFLFSEKTFGVGDIIQLGPLSGVVESVDMLSVKIRTFDNRLVRMPNETLIKENIINVTRWPQRRLDLSITLPYGVDPSKIEKLLRDSAATVATALAEPEPFFMVDSLGPNGITFAFGVWFRKDDFVSLKNALLPAILERLEAEGIRPSAQILKVLSSVAAPQTAPLSREFPDGL